MVKHIFEKGDIIYVDCAPQAGHEQSGRRPALVVSNSLFNEKEKSMAMVCPITNTDKNSPFHVKISGRNCKTSGFVMADQVRMLDVKARNAVLYDKAPTDVLKDVIEIICEIME